MAGEERFDVEELLSKWQPEPDLVVDGLHFGRGSLFEDGGAREVLRYETVEVASWRIVGDGLEKLDRLNHFQDDERYLIRRKYRRAVIDDNTVERSGDSSAVYFHWRGQKAGCGASPLPDDCEDENPPVERVLQWSEPPAFLQLFGGRFVVHLSRKQVDAATETRKKLRLYMLRGEIENEAHLYEVPPKFESLRSRTSFVIIKVEEAKSFVFIWHGISSPKHTREAIKNVAKYFANEIKSSSLLGELDEGCQEEREWFGVRENTPNKCFKFSPLSTSPRLFYCNTIMGNFMACEIDYPHRSHHITPFPFLQEHLYSAPQPALFLLVDGGDLWIWQGCADIEEEFIDENRVKNELKIIVRGALAYSKKRNIFLVHAGVEPDDFAALFPFWEEKSFVTQLQLKLGKKIGEKSAINENTNF